MLGICLPATSIPSGEKNFRAALSCDESPVVNYQHGESPGTVACLLGVDEQGGSCPPLRRNLLGADQRKAAS